MGAIAGALIGAAASLFGGRKSQKSAESMTAANIRLQREFAQQGIRWRVEDAKAAGLHPLYALGAQLPSFSPVYQQDSIGPAISDMGQNIGRAVAAQSTSVERKMQALSLASMANQVKEGDLRNQLLEREVNALSDQGFKTFPVPDTTEVDVMESHPDVISRAGSAGMEWMDPRSTPAQSFPGLNPRGGDLSVNRFAYPMWTEFTIGRGQKIVLPGGTQGDPAEALESLAESPVLMYWTYRENVERYGPKFADQMFSIFVGQPVSDALGWWKTNPIDWTKQQWEKFKEYRRSFNK